MSHKIHTFFFKKYKSTELQEKVYTRKKICVIAAVIVRLLQWFILLPYNGVDRGQYDNLC